MSYLDNILCLKARNFSLKRGRDQILTRCVSVDSGRFANLQPVARGQVPSDKAAVTADVYVLDVASRLPWVTFAKGTEGQGGGALDNIWKVAARFLKTQA